MHVAYKCPSAVNSHKSDEGSCKASIEPKLLRAMEKDYYLTALQRRIDGVTPPLFTAGRTLNSKLHACTDAVDMITICHSCSSYINLVSFLDHDTRAAYELAK